MPEPMLQYYITKIKIITGTQCNTGIPACDSDTDKLAQTKMSLLLLNISKIHKNKQNLKNTNIRENSVHNVRYYYHKHIRLF